MFINFIINYWPLGVSFAIGLFLSWPVSFYHHKKRYRDISLADLAMRRPQELRRLRKEIDRGLAQHAKETKRQRRKSCR